MGKPTLIKTFLSSRLARTVTAAFTRAYKVLFLGTFSFRHDRALVAWMETDQPALFGVWQSVPYLYADSYGILKRLSPDARRQVTETSSPPYRLALAFITLAPLPFAFTARPLAIIVTYTIVGSLFIPFLAATLLYLNNRVKWTSDVPHNHWTTNLLLIAILVLFAIVGTQEVMNAL